MSPMKRVLAAVLAMGFSTAPAAAESVKIADVIELTGGGATVGTNWRDAVALAFGEINAAGGILGKTVEL